MMRYILTLLILACVSMAKAQLIENLTVEEYYISDATDAVETDGGSLPEGSVTYRVYLDLQDGVKLRALYGDENHPFIISSTEVFFNNEDRGETFGNLIPDNRLDENTVALDSWLSFGAASESHWGVLKSDDDDGTILGGENNEDGMLSNEAIDIPLLVADGLMTSDSVISSVIFETGFDADTIFFDESQRNEFDTDDFKIQIDNPVDFPAYGNNLLIAQLTTSGELSFCINVELMDETGEVYKYVATSDSLLVDEFFSPFLKYPPTCGCIDPNYLEFDPAAICPEEGSCITEIIYGCSDTLACNYDPLVNFNVQELCCILPDNCNGLDSDILCPGFVSIDENEIEFSFLVYPNPTRSDIQVNINSTISTNYRFSIYDAQGKLVHSQNEFIDQGQSIINLNTSDFERGSYFVRIENDYQVLIEPFIKM